MCSDIRHHRRLLGTSGVKGLSAYLCIETFKRRWVQDGKWCNAIFA